MTGKMRPNNDRMRAISLALGGGVTAAVATMFIPTALLETITGVTGFSELVPAAAAPLGDTAQAIIAFIGGAIVLLLLLGFGLRKQGVTAAKTTRSEQSETTKSAPNLGERLNEFKDRFGKFPRLQIPWQRKENIITDLQDLPRLRNNDTHPDAPARRPISALVDLAETNLVPSPPIIAKASSMAETVMPATPLETSMPFPDKAPFLDETTSPKSGPASEEAVSIDAISIHPVEPNKLSRNQIGSKPKSAPAVSQSQDQPSLAEMVAQMEIAVALRKQQLQDLEQVAVELALRKVATGTVANAGADVHTGAEDQRAAEHEQNDRAVQPERALLEIVPNSDQRKDDDEMDAALHAALETLERMNRTAG